MALDLIGQTRALLTRAGQLDGQGLDEDQLAFLRDERDYRNLTMAELPRGDFAFTVLRNLFIGTWLKLHWERLADSSDSELAAIAGKAVKEARYHQQHAADWVVRLADGTDESRRRTEAALAELWRFVPEMFEADAVDDGGADQPAWARRAPRCARPGTHRSARCSPTPRLKPPAGVEVPQHRHPAACTPSTWATCWPRCSRCSASSPGACGEAGRRLGRARRGAGPRGPGAVGAATWASCATCARATTALASTSC